MSSYYDEPASLDTRPLSYMHAPSEVYESERTANRRGGGFFDMRDMAGGGNHNSSSNTHSTARNPLERTRSNDKGPGGGSPTDGSAGSLSPKSVTRMGSMERDGDFLSLRVSANRCCVGVESDTGRYSITERFFELGGL